MAPADVSMADSDMNGRDADDAMQVFITTSSFRAPQIFRMANCELGRATKIPPTTPYALRSPYRMPQLTLLNRIQIPTRTRPRVASPEMLPPSTDASGGRKTNNCERACLAGNTIA